jgi:hypothetical protein
VVTLSPNVLPTGAFWVTAMTSASSAVRSWQKLSWNFGGSIQTYPSLSGEEPDVEDVSGIVLKLIATG